MMFTVRRGRGELATVSPLWAFRPVTAAGCNGPVFKLLTTPGPGVGPGRLPAMAPGVTVTVSAAADGQ
jgi:hypothetical protein